LGGKIGNDLELLQGRQPETETNQERYPTIVSIVEQVVIGPKEYGGFRYVICQKVQQERH